MRLLLDTQAPLQWLTDDERLPRAPRTAIADTENEIHVSAASAWETATKRRLGKLDGVPEAAIRLPELAAADGFLHLSVDYIHVLRAGDFRVDHRNPFGRMLAAQSEIEQLIHVTADPAFALFEIETLSCGDTPFGRHGPSAAPMSYSID